MQVTVKKKRFGFTQIQFVLLLLQMFLCPGCRNHRVRSDEDTGQPLWNRLAGHQSGVQEAVWMFPLLPVRGQCRNSLTHTHMQIKAPVCDLVASSGEVADVLRPNIPQRTLPFQVCRWNYGGNENVKGPSKEQALVCPFWATVETWQCNMIEFVEEDAFCRY